MIHITTSNTKMKHTSNISLPPIISCGNNALFCKDYCYALKFYRMYPEVKKAWDDNLKELEEDQEYYFQSIRKHLLKKQPKYFRWHVSGDIKNQEYLDQMKSIAKDYCFVNFLAFTKQYNLDYSNKPENLSIVLSAWPGLKIPSIDMPIAYVCFKEEKRYINTYICPEDCNDCRICWNLMNCESVLLSVKRR